MPLEIQNGMSHTIDTSIDTKFAPLTRSIGTEVVAQTKAYMGQAAANIVASTHVELRNHSAKVDGTNAGLSNKLDDLSAHQDGNCDHIIRAIQDQSEQNRGLIQDNIRDGHDNYATVLRGLEELSAAQNSSNEVVIHRIKATARETSEAIQNQAHENISILERKMDDMNTLVQSIQLFMRGLATAQMYPNLGISNPEVATAITGLVKGLWMVLSSIYALLRSFV